MSIQSTPVPTEFFCSLVDTMCQWQDDQGRLIDPAVQRETQYGTAYFAYCAAKALKSGDERILQAAATNSPSHS